MSHYSQISAIEPLTTPYELKLRLPSLSHHKKFILESRKTIADIISGKDSRVLMIVGPCSIHDVASAKEYASKLKKLQSLVEDHLYLVMRVYFEKPRTTLGWKGFLYDPFLDGSNQISEGLRLSRQLLLDLIEVGIPTGTEFLDPLTSHFFSDLICWGSIGARTVSSQVHRQFASGMPIPFGFKNNTDGNLHTAIHAMITAASPHSYIGIDEMGQLATIRSIGNCNTHLVLRGGEGKPNYDKRSISNALKCLHQYGLPTRVMVDCSHDNSFKRHDLQPLVFESLISQLQENKGIIIGAILESHLSAGSQSLLGGNKNLKYGTSLTDSCIDFSTTEDLLLRANHLLKNTSTISLLEPSMETSICSI